MLQNALLACRTVSVLPESTCCTHTHNVPQEAIKVFEEIARICGAGEHVHEKLVDEVEFWLNFILSRLEHYLK